MSANLKKLRPYDEPPHVREPLVPGAPDSAATLWLAIGALWLLVAAGLGTLWIAQLMFPAATLQLHFPLPFGLNIWVIVDGHRTASAFQNALVYGWLSNAGIGAAWFIVPRITGRSLVSNAGANVALGLWNLAVILGLASIFLGTLPGTGPLSEFPLPIDALAALALLMVNGIFWATVAPSLGRGTYVSVLYFGIGLLAFLGLYVLESLVPLLNLGETPSALANAFFVRVLETYWLLGAAVATLYYVIPRATGNPLYSNGMAMLGWLIWLVMALLSGLSRLLDPSIASAVTTAGTAATILLVLHALLVSGNLVLSIRGRWSVALLPGTAAFALVALVFVLTSSIIEAVGSLRSVQEVIDPTEWVDGALVFAALGAYTLAALAVIDYAFPRLLRRAWGTNGLSIAEFWLVWGGAALAGAALMFGGLAQGSLLGQGITPDQIDGTLLWFRFVALGGIGLVTLGALALVVDLFLMYTAGRPVAYQVTAAEPLESAGPGTPTTASTPAL
jgi:cbb3-type cytochrome oxidase subunit 1